MARHLARVVEFADDAIVSKDLTGTITSWNRGAERIFGYTEAEAVGRSIRMIIPDDRQAEEDAVLSRIRAGDIVNHYETLRRRKDGTLIPISLTVSPIYNDAGVVVGASKIARDISERVGLEAAAREQVTITEKLTQTGAWVASTLDHTAIVQRVTDTATELTHAQFGVFFYESRDPQTGARRPQYVLSGAVRDSFSAFPAPQSAQDLEALFRGEGSVRLADVTLESGYEKELPRFGLLADPAPIRSYLAVPVRGVTRDVLGGLFFGHSRPGIFTEQHQRIAEGIAASTSVPLENARLFFEAQNANRMKDEFLAVLSHELRTPLNAILGYSRLLRSGMLTGEKADRGLETLERNAHWLAQIVEDVLDVSRIVSGKLQLDVQPIELPLVIHNAVATVQIAADAKGVRLETTVGGQLGPLSGDADRLQQVVWNLLSNAVKFTPAGGRVDVIAERCGTQVEIVVRDTGLGIRPEFLPHVFERFRQGDAGATRKSGGLGLGLAIVRHIVEAHGGTIEAASEGEGRGATFIVRLPLARTRDFGAKRHLAADHIDPLTGLADLRGIRVLAVDDEHDALALVQVVLEKAGADVITVDSPVAALERIEALRPQALIVDLAMPEMDGFELISRVRASADEQVRSVPAAALTAFARSEDRTKALRSGFELHLAKPVDPGELVASVATLVRGIPRE
jgi:PAS domain S-box-containing protein